MWSKSVSVRRASPRSLHALIWRTMSSSRSRASFSFNLSSSSTLPKRSYTASMLSGGAGSPCTCATRRASAGGTLMNASSGLCIASDSPGGSPSGESSVISSRTYSTPVNRADPHCAISATRVASVCSASRQSQSLRCRLRLLTYVSAACAARSELRRSA